MSTVPEIKFGTDGWRGIIAWDFNFDNVRKTAQAIADYARSASPVPLESQNLIVVGYDRRFLSGQFAEEIALVLRANKLGVTLLDSPSPTPEISLLTSKKFWLGVMVTASHNPFQYNGIKIKVGGRSAPETVTKSVEALLGKASPLAAQSATVQRKNFRDAYLAHLASRVNPKPLSQGLKTPVIADYMYGSGAGTLEKLVTSKKFSVIRGQADPMFAGIHPEPIAKNLAPLMEAVVKNKAAAGFALDGDGDRIGLVDDKGRFVTPQRVMALLLHYLVNVKKLKGPVVQCVSQGYLAKRMAKDLGLPFEEVPVGFKYLADKMISDNALLCAEESGGFAWRGCTPERDGALCALLLLEMLVKTGKKPSELLDAIEKKYGKSVFERGDHRIQRAVPDKAVFAEKLKKKLPKKLLGHPVAQALTIDGLKIILDNNWWVLMRPSGTEPLMRIYAETESGEKTKELLEYAAKLVSGHI
ncbi:MAG: hypothetical protein PHP45_09795 [Elusimicrobiales bacterium]|nr:hypothetical protein [Elusimicrobiales bacterium]